MSATLSRSVFDFLTDLAAHNERDWFNAHKDRYQAALAEVKAFADALLERVGATRTNRELLDAIVPEGQ